jgi:hypothetical protein
MPETLTGQRVDTSTRTTMTGLLTQTHPGSGLRPRGNLAAHAYDYTAGAHWPVFVLGRTKRPVANCPPCHDAGPDHDPAACTCLTCHGFYAASTDPDRVTAMLDAVPGGLLAIRTGAASGLLVVDIDPAHGGRLDPTLMTPTAAVATGGGGWHLYYRHPGHPVPSRPLPGHLGVDIKADGGYVVAPPSRHPRTGHPYRWVGGRVVEEMPPALLSACLATTAPPTPPTGPITTTPGGGISYPARLLAAHLDAVARAPEGRRRVTLYGAARGVARMVAAGAITPADAITALTAAGRDAGQSAREIRAAITGGFHAEGVPA